MKLSEEELKKRIQESADKVQVPEKLRPENMEKLLEGKKQKKSFHWKPAYSVAAAACCVLIAGGAVLGNYFYVEKDRANLSASGEQAAEAQMADGAEAQTENGAKAQTADGTQKADETRGTGGKQTADEEITADVKTASAIGYAEDYDEIYAYMQEERQIRERQAQNYGAAESVQETARTGGETGAAPAASAKTAAADTAADAGAGAEYSDTNIREAGVQEGDIIKTDGENLYILNGQRVQIVGLDGPEMEAKGVIRLEEEQRPSELYVKDKKLILVYTQSEYLDDGTGYGGTYKQYTVAETYDVSSPESPKSLGQVRQSGSYYTMRVNGDYVYLLSSFLPDTSAARGNSEAYIPQIQGKLLDSGSILMPQFKRGSRYTVVSSFSLKDPEKRTDSKAIFGSSGQIYVSGNHIYSCESDYLPEDAKVTQTCIRKVAYKDGKLEAVGQARVDGILNDSFSLDEYKGNLRLVTTVSSTTDVQPIAPLFRGMDATDTDAKEEKKDSNSLYILDKELNELGRIEGLAEDEQVYSARFMGDMGYFVTYRQVDPLFSVDLSDPKQPKVVGKLKIPGFSEYLHPYGDGLLLGIGMDVDETGTTTNGVKLSMFDISDAKAVEEVQKYVIEDSYSTELFYNYKSALIDTERNLIGFSSYGTTQHYYIFSYGKDGFQCIFDRELTGGSSARGVYVDKTFYLAAGNTVEAYDMEGFKKLDDIVL